MAKDTVLGPGGFTPSMGTTYVRRDPDTVNGVWNLEGAAIHFGRNPKNDMSLVPKERRVLVALYRNEPFEKMIQFADVLKTCGVEDAATYWLPSLMQKLLVSSLPQLFEKVRENPDLLESPDAQPTMAKGISAGGPITSPQGG